MPTKNPRISVVLEPDLYRRLSRLSHKEGLSLSLCSRDLIKEALELREDIYWGKAAEERDKSFSYKEALSHNQIWK